MEVYQSGQKQNPPFGRIFLTRKFLTEDANNKTGDSDNFVSRPGKIVSMREFAIKDNTIGSTKKDWFFISEGVYNRAGCSVRDGAVMRQEQANDGGLWHMS